MRVKVCVYLKLHSPNLRMKKPLRGFEEHRLTSEALILLAWISMSRTEGRGIWSRSQTLTQTWYEQISNEVKPLIESWKNVATNVFLASISLLCYSIIAFVHSITMTLTTMPRTRSENVESSRLASKSNTDGEKERCALLMCVYNHDYAMW